MNMNMDSSCTLLAVRNIKESVAFYTGVLGYTVQLDIGMNVTLSGHLALQEFESWAGFLLEIPQEEVAFGGNDKEIVLETDDMDAFLALLESRPDVAVVHPVRTYPWGQRVVRIYDPDKHIIEVGESMKLVVQRFLAEGQTVEQVQETTMFPPEMILLWKQEMEAQP